MKKLLKNYVHSATYKHTVIAWIIWLLFGFSAFLIFNPSVRVWLFSDITGNISTNRISGDIGYSASSSKLIVTSNISKDNIKSIEIMISHSPEIEVTLKTPNNKVTIEKLGPSMTKYSIPQSSVKAGESIATFTHNGKSEDILLGSAQIISNTNEVTNLSISNATP